MATIKNPKGLFWLIICAGLLLGANQALFTTIYHDASPLIISEFVAANGNGLADEDGDYSDWIEIYNQGDTAINLAGWSLTDDPNDLEKWLFPNRTLASGEYLVIFASGKNRNSSNPNSILHTNFRLNQQGEFLGLYDILGQSLIDAISPRFPNQFRDISYGRSKNGPNFYFDTPTPGKPNDETRVWQGLVAPVKFSAERGFYDESFELELTTDTPGVTIHYTTDGSEPTETNGAVYTKPIEITTTTSIRAIGLQPNYLAPGSNTHTYIFLDDVLRQPANPQGFPATWGTHKVSIWNYVSGTPVIADYEMDPEVTNDPDYRHTLKNDLKSIPTMSIVTDAENLDIYANPQERGIAWERPVSVELIHPDSDQQGFQINAGIRIHGARGRQEYIPKHSFRLFFRAKYGLPKLIYPLFPTSSVETFDTLILRGGVNRSYAGQFASSMTGFELTTYTRDEWMRSTQVEMSGSGSHGIFVHLYLNGLYWGLYNVVERPDTSFMASYFGGDENSWYVMTADGPRGNSEEVFEALQYELYSINNLEAADRYPAIKRRVDTTHFADYVILNWYAGTKDWPHNNWYAGVQLPEGQIRYFVWDGEVTWLDGARISLGQNNNLVKRFFDAFIQYPDFKMEFADRLYKHLFNDGALTDANAQARWLRLNNLIDRAIVGESARWGDARYESPITREHWLEARDAVLAQMDGNAAKLIRLARKADYYPDLDPPAFNQPGGLVTPGFKLMMAPERTESAVYYTTDGSDPRTPITGDIAPTAKLYTSPIVITTTTPIKARIFSESPPASASPQIWSALNQATFSVISEDHNLRITEIMYNPMGGNDYEFIELQNAGNTELTVSNFYFEGINYTFPTNTSLAPNEIVVLVRNPEAFAERYPHAVVSGIYTGKLSNRGERVTLRNVNDQVITSVEYDDENGWPISPDGRGDSLSLIDLTQNPNNPKNWRASVNPNGSPGVKEPR